MSYKGSFLKTLKSLLITIFSKYQIDALSLGLKTI